MKITDAMEKISNLARSAGCKEFDIIGYDSFSESVEVFEKKVSNTEISRSSALGIRLFKDHRPGVAFTEKLSEDALRVCLEDAISHTALTDPVSFSVAEPLPAVSGSFNHISPEFDQVPFADLIRFAIDLEDKARSIDGRIENVPYTGAARQNSSSYFLNSNGIAHEHTDQDFSAYVAAVAAAGEQKKMGFYSNSRLNFSELKDLEIAERAVERSIEQLGATPVKAGEYRVLFSNRISGQVFSLYSPAFFAELAIRGQSRLKGRLGDQIASSCLNLRSVAHDKSLRGSRARDAEGMPTRDIHLVENGRFSSFLYNLEAAALDKTQSTGNGARSVGSKGGTSFRNLVVTAGKQSTRELTNQGPLIVIDKLEGAAGCSSVSGELSIGAQGFLYDRGERQQAVDRITLSGNFFDILQNIEAVSSEYNDQMSSVRVPDLLISKIAVAG